MHLWIFNDGCHDWLIRSFFDCYVYHMQVVKNCVQSVSQQKYFCQSILNT